MKLSYDERNKENGQVRALQQNNYHVCILDLIHCVHVQV
jgi:hypothetical protein